MVFDEDLAVLPVFVKLEDLPRRVVEIARVADINIEVLGRQVFAKKGKKEAGDGCNFLFMVANYFSEIMANHGRSGLEIVSFYREIPF